MTQTIKTFICYLFGHTWRPWQGDFFEPYCVRCGHKPGLAQILRDAARK